MAERKEQPVQQQQQPPRPDKPFGTVKKGELPEIKQGLLSNKDDKKKEAAKNLIEVMSTGTTDVSGLFDCVLKCCVSNNLEIKKLCYLYIANLIKDDPDLATKAITQLQTDCSDPNPLLRALALRTFSLIRLPNILEFLADPLQKLLRDSDPYVIKTAAIAVAKAYELDPQGVEKCGFLDILRTLVTHGNSMVVSNTVTALSEINSLAPLNQQPPFTVDDQNFGKLLTALEECNEWGIVIILDAFAAYMPRNPSEAQKVVECVIPRLQHGNSAVSMGAVKVLARYLEFCNQTQENESAILGKLAPPLVSLLSKEPEIQYVALRNINLLLKKQPSLLQNDMKVFFCKYDDPLYVKMEKLEIMIMLSNDKNIDTVLAEFKEYATKVDVEFVRKSVRAIGRSAIKLPNAADKCVLLLLDLIKSTKLNYVVQEAIVVIKDIFRRYPDQYESIISTLCQNLEALDEAEARAAIVWILGEYADRIDGVEKILETFISTFKEEDTTVQLSLLTATVKLYLLKPASTQPLVRALLQTATTEVDNPDIRDRGFVYWRLLSSHMNQAKQVVLSPKPTIKDDADTIDTLVLDELIANMSTLSSVYHKPPSTFVTRLKNRVVAAALSVSGGVIGLGESTVPQSPPRKARAPPPIPSSGVPVQVPPPPPPQPEVPPVEPLPVIGLLLPGDGEGAHGLVVNGGFVVSGGQLILELIFTNGSTETVGPFMIKFNKNTFQVTPAMSLGIQSLAPNETKSCSLPCNCAPPVEILPTDLVQVALKTNLGVVFFAASLPLYRLFVPDGRLDKDQYHKIWRSIETEQCADITDLTIDDINHIRLKLEANKVFFVASRSVSDEEFLYVTAKTIDGSLFLMELGFQGNTCKLCTKTEAEHLVPLLAQSIQLILTTP